MMPSRALRLLTCLGLALLAAQRPTEAHACDGGEGGPFWLDEVWPADGATDVPTDGVLLLRGLTAAGEYPVVAVDLAGVPVDGAVEYWSPSVSLWRAAAPLEPGATYHVAVTDADGTTELTFTTGDAPAAPPDPPAVVALALEQYELELRECADTIVSCSCESWKTVDVEDRMRARVVLPAPSAPFGAYNFVAVELAPGPDQFPADMVHTQPWPATDDLTLLLDFGVAGTWPSEQVCARAAAIDPVGHRIDGIVSCLPIANVNTPPTGCTADCRTTPPTPAALAALALLALVSRRRRATP